MRRFLENVFSLLMVGGIAIAICAGVIFLAYFFIKMVGGVLGIFLGLLILVIFCMGIVTLLEL